MTVGLLVRPWNCVFFGDGHRPMSTLSRESYRRNSLSPRWCFHMGGESEVMLIRDNKIQPLHCCVVNIGEGIFWFRGWIRDSVTRQVFYCTWKGVLCSTTGVRSSLVPLLLADKNIGVYFGRYNVDLTIISGLHIILNCRLD